MASNLCIGIYHFLSTSWSSLAVLWKVTPRIWILCLLIWDDSPCHRECFFSKTWLSSELSMQMTGRPYGISFSIKICSSLITYKCHISCMRYRDLEWIGGWGNAWKRPNAVRNDNLYHEKWIIVMYIWS